MLIFVQVCRTIDKNSVSLKSSIGSERTNKEQGNLQKGSLCCKKASEEKRLKIIKSILIRITLVRSCFTRS